MGGKHCRRKRFLKTTLILTLKASLQEYRDAQKLKGKKEGRLFKAAGTFSVANTSRRESEVHSSREREAVEEGSLEQWKRKGDWQNYNRRCEQEKENRSRKDEEYNWRVERAHRDAGLQGCSLRSPPGPLPPINDQRELKRENDMGFKERYESRRVVEYKMPSSRMGQEESILGSSRGDASKFSNESGSEEEAHHGIEELRRKGDFANWKTAVVKREETKKGEGNQSAQSLPPPLERDEEDEIQRLHRCSHYLGWRRRCLNARFSVK